MSDKYKILWKIYKHNYCKEVSEKMRHRIIIGDCRKALRKLQDSSVHLVITSPPYNVGMDYGNWKDKLPQKEYLKLTKTWLKECYRVLVDGGKVCVNLPLNDKGNIMFFHYDIMRKLGFKFVSNIVWIKWDSERKEKFAVSKWKIDRFKFPAQPDSILISTSEVIMVMQKNSGYSKGKRDLRFNEFKKWKYNVWFIKPIAEREHPAPYPVELVKRLIKLYSLAGQTVLDPFLGTGTTSIAAMKLGRGSIGIEMNPDYVEMVKEMIDNYVIIECL